MNKGAPVSSKLLTKKWIRQDHEIHLKRLREIKPIISLASPTQY